jgi:hypothetical protein
MNVHALLVALFVILALAGWAPVATEQGRAPYAPYPETDRHTHGGVDM